MTRRLHYSYEMTLSFSAPVRRHTFMLRFVPPTDTGQQSLGRRVICEPYCRLAAGRDAFFNGVETGYIPQDHTQLHYRCEGTVFICGRRGEERLERILLYPSPLTEANAQMRAFARAHDPGGGAGALARAGALMDAMRTRMAYEPGMTHERTSAQEAFALGKGVCQDMAPVLIALCRTQGIGARYVAGLIPGEGQTHAWAEIYTGDRFAGLDPTNACGTDERYLPVNRGRDARDCAVNRGVFWGAALQTQRICATLE